MDSERCNSRRTIVILLTGGFLFLLSLPLLLLSPCNKKPIIKDNNICQNISQLDKVLKEHPKDALHRLTMVTDILEMDDPPGANLLMFLVDAIRTPQQYPEVISQRLKLLKKHVWNRYCINKSN